MTAYYNENDKDAAAWLRTLISESLIAPGDVDERSIVDVRPADLASYAQCHFFAGIGGWSLALRLDGWPDDRPVWTGSCPCQPFSLAGAQKGFADARHLWPIWRELIRERRPATVFGEQVASATAWLGLVRSDLEAMDYAVGAMPIQAASAGADHLRDRYWFVGDDTRVGRGEGWPEHEVRSGRATIAGASSTIDLANTNDARSQGRSAVRECAGERPVGADGVADAHEFGEGKGRQQRSGEQRGPGGDQEACASGDMANTVRDGTGRGSTDSARPQGEAVGIDGCLPRPRASTWGDGEIGWVIGADGKARRVKSGVRLLVDGFPNRVGLLRGFGNAIDPRPAAAFIGAAREACDSR